MGPGQMWAHSGCFVSLAYCLPTFRMPAEPHMCSCPLSGSLVSGPGPALMRGRAEQGRALQQASLGCLRICEQFLDQRPPNDYS